MGPVSAQRRPRCGPRGADGTVLGMILVESLTKTYGGFTAVDDVTFRAEAGRVTGFLGPNGAGKSTTMRILVGLTPASSGTATVPDAVRRPAQPRPRGRRPARRLRPARRAHRPRDPRPSPTTMGLPRGPGRRDARPGQPDPRGGRAPGAELLARHAPAARHRHRADRRPRGADPRRAGQRPRPGRDPVDARPAARLRRPRAAPCCSPRTCCTRSRSSPTTWS